ncbi:MAG TPA: hypothetical protein DCR40_01480 [Prolixibacteraceae bacterium]|nr:hypothetical protein [Prolixibacteraceae bacterium]
MDVSDSVRVDDPIYYILNLPLEATPGKKFHYNSGGTNKLGEMIRRTTG